MNSLPSTSNTRDPFPCWTNNGYGDQPELGIRAVMLTPLAMTFCACANSRCDRVVFFRTGLPDGLFNGLDFLCFIIMRWSLSRWRQKRNFAEPADGNGNRDGQSRSSEACPQDCRGDRSGRDRFHDDGEQTNCA